MERDTPSLLQRATPVLLLFGVGALLTVDALFGEDGQRWFNFLYVCIGFLVLMVGWGNRYAAGPDLLPIETVWFGWTGLEARRHVCGFLAGLVIVSLVGTVGLGKLLVFFAWFGPIRAALFMASDQFVLLLFWIVLGAAGGLWMLLLRLADFEIARMTQMQRKQIAVVSFFVLITFAAVAKHHAWPVALGVAAASGALIGAVMLLVAKRD